MNEISPRPINEYALSTANVDKSNIRQIFRPVQAFIEDAKRSGFESGVELWPMGLKWPIPTTIRYQIETGQLAPYSNDIASFHQSPRSETLKDITKGPNEVGMVTLLPHFEDISYLQKIKSQIGDKPAVLYRNLSDHLKEEIVLSQRWIQPDPELAKDWEVTTVDEFIKEMEKRNFNGVCLDTNHIRRAHKTDKEYDNPLSKWNESIPAFVKSGKLKELHIGVGRIDMPAVNVEDSLQEVRDLLNGTEISDIIPMLKLLNEEGWKGKVVLEILPTAIKQVRGDKGLWLPPEAVIDSYERIRNTVGRIFND